jgi:hypothetical protein
MMKRTLSLLSMAVVAISLQAQATQNPSAGMGEQDAQAMEVAAVTTELTKRIDTKGAKVGDGVEARVVAQSKLPDGTDLPRGTKFVGKVTDVKAKSKEDKNSHLAFSLDRAVTKDGKEIPVQAIVVSVTAPTSPSAPSAMSSPAPSSMGGVGSGAGGGGGVAGSGSASAPVPTHAPPMVTDSGDSPVMGGMLKSSRDRVPVGNMPGVMLTGSSDAGTAAALDGDGKNIALASGTTMILSVGNGR